MFPSAGNFPKSRLNNFSTATSSAEESSIGQDAPATALDKLGQLSSQLSDEAESHSSGFLALTRNKPPGLDPPLPEVDVQTLRGGTFQSRLNPATAGPPGGGGGKGNGNNQAASIRAKGLWAKAREAYMPKPKSNAFFNLYKRVMEERKKAYREFESLRIGEAPKAVAVEAVVESESDEDDEAERDAEIRHDFVERYRRDKRKSIFESMVLPISDMLLEMHLMDWIKAMGLSLERLVLKVAVRNPGSLELRSNEEVNREMALLITTALFSATGNKCPWVKFVDLRLQLNPDGSAASTRFWKQVLAEKRAELEAAITHEDLLELVFDTDKNMIQSLLRKINSILVARLRSQQHEDEPSCLQRYRDFQANGYVWGKGNKGSNPWLSVLPMRNFSQQRAQEKSLRRSLGETSSLQSSDQSPESNKPVGRRMSGGGLLPEIGAAERRALPPPSLVQRSHTSVDPPTFKPGHIPVDVFMRNNRGLPASMSSLPPRDLLPKPEGLPSESGDLHPKAGFKEGPPQDNLGKLQEEEEEEDEAEEEQNQAVERRVSLNETLTIKKMEGPERRLPNEQHDVDREATGGGDVDDDVEKKISGGDEVAPKERLVEIKKSVREEPAVKRYLVMKENDDEQGKGKRKVSYGKSEELNADEDDTNRDAEDEDKVEKEEEGNELHKKDDREDSTDEGEDAENTSERRGNRVSGKYEIYRTPSQMLIVKSSSQTNLRLDMGSNDPDNTIHTGFSGDQNVNRNKERLRPMKGDHSQRIWESQESSRAPRISQESHILKTSKNAADILRQKPRRISTGSTHVSLPEIPMRRLSDLGAYLSKSPTRRVSLHDGVLKMKPKHQVHLMSSHGVEPDNVSSSKSKRKGILPDIQSQKTLNYSMNQPPDAVVRRNRHRSMEDFIL